MAALGAVAFLMVAGWQVGADGAEEELFNRVDVELDNAIEGSGSADRCVVIYFPDLCTVQVWPVYREYYGKYVC